MTHVKIEEPKGYWRVFHSHGCGGVVFYIKTKPRAGDMPIANEIILTDGTTPQSGTMAFCGSCGEQVDIGSLIASESTFIE